MRILIYRLGSLGDTVLALPCFHRVRETYPDATITVLTNAPVSGKAAPLESVLEHTGLIDEVIHYPLGLRSPRQLLALGARLRARKFDLLVSLAAARGRKASFRDYLFFKACGIPRIVGIPFLRKDLTPAPRLGEPGLFESEARRLLRRARSLGIVDLRDKRWFDLRLTAEENAAAERLLPLSLRTEKFIAASPGTKWPANDWGDANWIRLLAELSREQPELGLVFLGAADEAERAQALLGAWRGPHANLCGQASPRESAAVLARAALFVGHDSGPMHLAAAAGTWCVAIFSARCAPGQWYPVGEGHRPLYPMAFYDPVQVNDVEYQRKALASIRVEDVLRTITESLAKAGRSDLSTSSR